MRFFRPSLLTRWFLPGVLTRVRTGDRLLWLTFDDGPDPVSTPHLLEILRSHDIRAAFFCSGKAAERYPGLMTDIRSEGHIVGNHGYDHIDGWRTSAKEYINNVERAVPFTSGWLFRPPYGHMTPGQYRALSQKFRIILWDIMPYDFDDTLRPARSLQILMSGIRNGSTIVLHDLPGSSVHGFLNEFIARSLDNGYRFIPVPEMLSGHSNVS